MWATPTIPDRRLGVNDDYYAWVIGGCPNQDVLIVQNGESARIELSTPTFKFKDFEEVYFHAQVKACKNADCVSYRGTVHVIQTCFRSCAIFKTTSTLMISYRREPMYHRD